jgi:hypothetical protein
MCLVPRLGDADAVAEAAAGSATWSEEDSRKNFELVKSRVIPGNPDISKLLRHPLAESAGGDPHHDGGKHWTSKQDPEWQMLAAWVKGRNAEGSGSSPRQRPHHPDQQRRR